VRIVTWNVNSIRARMPRFLPWLEEQAPDVVCLQETKVVDELFPLEPIEELGYSVAFHGRPTYNGVAILSRVGLEDVRKGMDEDSGGLEDERRVISAVVDGRIRVVNVYVVNGREVGCDKYEHKLEWMAHLAKHLEGFDLAQEQVVVAGDYNVTFDDRDVYDPERWHEKILCSTPEREALNRLIDLGLADSFRKFHEEAGHWTWWDFRTRGFQRGDGLRIDHLLMSRPALEACTGVEVDIDARAGEKPSDHAPVIATVT